MGNSNYRASASPSGTVAPRIKMHSMLMLALTLMLGMAACLVLWRGEAPAPGSDSVEMAAATPARDGITEANAASMSTKRRGEPGSETSLALQHSGPTADNTTQVADKRPMVWTDETASDKQPISHWRLKHLARRHIAAISSRSDSSELSYLCMEGVSCGWILDLNDNNICKGDRKGKLFSVRVQAESLVHDFESKCIANGLVSLAFNASEKPVFTGMVKTSESLVFSSVDSSIIFKSQHYYVPVRADAIDSARSAAGIEQDNRSL